MNEERCGVSRMPPMHPFRSSAGLALSQEGPSASPCPSSAWWFWSSHYLGAGGIIGIWEKFSLGPSKMAYGHRFSCYSRFLTARLPALGSGPIAPGRAVNQAKHLFSDLLLTSGWGPLHWAPFPRCPVLLCVRGSFPS